MSFGQQLDPDANRMAALTVEYPADRDACDARWAGILDDETIERKTVLFGGRVAGSVLSFEQSGEREVTYWISKESWGKGLAAAALSRLLDHVTVRPLYVPPKTVPRPSGSSKNAGSRSAARTEVSPTPAAKRSKNSF